MRAFEIGKWPVLVLGIALLLAVLYWVAPNAPGWLSVDHSGQLSRGARLGGRSGFAIYVAYFDSYNKTYGTLGGVIIFLVWLWMTNVAVLLGAEFDAELSRGRELEAGEPGAHEKIQLPPRDAPKRSRAGLLQKIRKLFGRNV